MTDWKQKAREIFVEGQEYWSLSTPAQGNAEEVITSIAEALVEAEAAGYERGKREGDKSCQIVLDSLEDCNDAYVKENHALKAKIQSLEAQLAVARENIQVLKDCIESFGCVCGPGHFGPKICDGCRALAAIQKQTQEASDKTNDGEGQET